MLPLPPVPPVPAARLVRPPPPDDADFATTNQILATQAVGGAGGGPGLDTYPFKIVPGSAPLKVKVSYGTVEDIEPTDIDTDIEIDDDSTDNWLFLECTLDADGQVTGGTVQLQGSPPSDSGSAAYKLIGRVETAGGVITKINQSLYFSQGFAACGRDPDDFNTTPGSYHFYVD